MKIEQDQDRLKGLQEHKKNNCRLIPVNTLFSDSIAVCEACDEYYAINPKIKSIRYQYYGN